jgi:DNA helicase-2/ATP-dependent DNA helicase PcrA
MGISRPSRPAKTPMFTINTPAKPNPNSDAAAAAGVALHTADELYKGQHIEHMKFGNGEIIEILSTDIGDSVIVEFEAWGEKRLLLKYANFKIID